MPEKVARTPNAEGRRRSTRSGAQTPATGRVAGRGPATEDEGLPTADAFPHLLGALEALEAGDFSVRLPVQGGPMMKEIAAAFNRIAALNERELNEMVR
ncbi:MAG: hypothetical protein M3483_05300, partial [Gemmatimonadota bacterium]|nr:hypothetical protein [Gemmatimonadota bacterium]